APSSPVPNTPPASSNQPSCCECNLNSVKDSVSCQLSTQAKIPTKDAKQSNIGTATYHRRSRHNGLGCPTNTSILRNAVSRPRVAPTPHVIQFIGTAFLAVTPSIQIAATEIVALVRQTS